MSPETAAKIDSDEFWDEEEAVTREGFIIDNDQKAEWALRIIAKNNREYNRYSEACQLQISLYNKKDELAKTKRDESNKGLISKLEKYFETADTKAAKTQAAYKLPSGKLVKKFEKQELKYDKKILLEALKDTEFVEDSPKLKWDDYKKTLKIVDGRAVNGDGEIIDIVTVEIKPSSFNVEV